MQNLTKSIPFLLLSAAACGGSQPNAAGMETSACVDGACFGDLVCLSDVCVEPSNTDGANTDGQTGNPSTMSASATSATSTSAGPGTSAGPTTAPTTTADTTSTDDTTDTDETDGPGPTGPAIPETCKQAEAGESSVGCVFYAVDLDTSADELQFAVAAANVQTDAMANVSVQTRQGGAWVDLQGPEAVPPLELHEFLLPEANQERTGVNAGSAYRIVADVPIVAYQFNPVDGATSFLSDASMLFPVPTWDSINHAVNVGFSSTSPGAGYPYMTIVGAVDDTNVAFTARVATTAGGGIPAAAAGETINFTIGDGDVAQITAADQASSLTGSRIITDEAHPIAVFQGHSCVNIPDDVCCCDHLEEQISGVRQWGQSFVAAHMPVRSSGDPEATFWQVYASEDDTDISFDFGATVTGLPGPQASLDAGEVGEYFVTAPAGSEADFLVNANKPIAVVGYMTSSENFGSDIGDPAMTQYVATEQFLPRYVVLVPGTWVNDVLVLTRPAGAPIEIDGVAVPNADFEAVGDGTWEVARVDAADGVHVLDGGDANFGVVVVGYDQYDSYAYVGGTGTVIINPNPG